MNTLSWARRAGTAILLIAVSGQFASSMAWAQTAARACAVLPANNIWNTPVDTLPVLTNSSAW